MGCLILVVYVKTMYNNRNCWFLSEAQVRMVENVPVICVKIEPNYIYIYFIIVEHYYSLFLGLCWNPTPY